MRTTLPRRSRCPRPASRWRASARRRAEPHDRPGRAVLLRHRFEARADLRGRRPRILDDGGLEPAKQTWSGLTVDGLDPRLVSATTGDTDSDGELDSISVGFSESVVHAQEASQGSFTAAPFTILSAEAASGSTVELKLQQSGSGDTGARPAGHLRPGRAGGRARRGRQLRRSRDDPAGDRRRAARAALRRDRRRRRQRPPRPRHHGLVRALDHPDDSATPFPVSVEQLSSSRRSRVSAPRPGRRWTSTWPSRRRPIRAPRRT